MGRIYSTIVFTILLATTTAQAGSTTTPSDTDARIARFIIDLADPDAVKRDVAVENLLMAGVPAQSAIEHAARSSVPERALRAHAILNRTPWNIHSFGDDIDELLADYAPSPVSTRCDVVQKLGALPDSRGMTVLIWIVLSDADDSVRWSAAAALESAPGNIDLDHLRKLADATSNAPALRLAGWAWEKKDFPRAIALYERAFVVNVPSPGVTPNSLFDAFSKVVSLYEWKNQYADEARVLRLQVDQCAGIGDDNWTLNSLEKLFALHAMHGQQPGFAYDLIRYAPALGHRSIVYFLGVIAERNGYAMVGQSLCSIAKDAPATDPLDDRARVAAVLNQAKLYEQAIGEFRAIIEALHDEPSEKAAFFAHFQLLFIATEMKDHAAAAAEGHIVVERFARFPDLEFNAYGWERSGYTALNHLQCLELWHRMLAEKARGDLDSATRDALQLASLAPCDGDPVIDAVNLLRDAGKPHAADYLFAIAHDAARKVLAEKPDDDSRLNNFLWMCAKCQRALPEALALAKDWMKRSPENAWPVDDAAEMEFAQGHVDEAIRLETHAIELDPHFPFLREQLERFKKGK